MNGLRECATWDRGVDLVAVQRVMEGTLPASELRPEEVRYAATHAKCSAREAAKILGVAERTVAIWRGAAT